MNTHPPIKDRTGESQSVTHPCVAPPSRPQTPAPRRRYRAVLALGGFAVALLVAGIVPKLHAQDAQAAQVTVQRELIVSTISPTPAPATQDLLLPAVVTAWADASIYARTSGYVQHWYTDIGAHVKAGQTLAQIETPELDAQLQQAKADEATAEANYHFASTTAQRWQKMLQTQSVSEQDAQAKTSDAAAKLAILQAAEANVARLQELVSYRNVRAPFDGVISVRNVQVGALVTAGGTPGLATAPGELFHVEQTDRLRVYVDVPQDDASLVTPGTTVWLSTQQYPGRRFAASVARTSNAIDPVSRTMRVEVDVDNKDGALMPGAYAQVHFGLTTATPGLEVPVSAMLFRPDGVIVAVVDVQSKVQLRTVTIGRDFGTYVEIATGLAATDRVINNPGDAIATGQSVHVAAAAAAGKA
jgi:membrane fusion protein, multidrug efflux system